MQPMITRRSQVALGGGAMAIATVIALIVGVLYFSPPRGVIVSFHSDDVAAIHPGDPVRIAGITVGTVKDLTIESDRILVRTTVDQDAYVGDQSQVQVRMRTVVGGYYVAIESLGDAPLGRNTIPKERVTLPYSLMETLVGTTPLTENIQTASVRDSIDQVQRGLTGENASVLTELISAGNSVTESIRRQRGQITKILSTTNEYVKALNNNRAAMEHLIDRIAVIVETLTLYSEGFAKSLKGMGDIVERLQSVSGMYMNHRTDYLKRMRGILTEFQGVADRNGIVVRVLGRIRHRMEIALDQQNATPLPETLTTDICVPTEAARC